MKTAALASVIVYTWILTRLVTVHGAYADELYNDCILPPTFYCPPDEACRAAVKDVGRRTTQLGTKKIDLGTTTPTEFNTCESDYLEVEGTCFYFSTEKVIWKEAKAKCEERGETLATIDTKLKQLVIELKANSTGVRRNYWIGLNDKETKDKHQWLSGVPFNFTWWCPNEPNDGWDNRQECVHLWGRKEYCWDDLWCSQDRYYICEKPL